MVNYIGWFFIVIDIYFGVKIGCNFFIDYGFIVIGEMVEIGDDVIIY